APLPPEAHPRPTGLTRRHARALRADRTTVPQPHPSRRTVARELRHPPGMPRRPGPPSPTQLAPAPLPRVHLAGETLRSDIDAHLRDGAWGKTRRGPYVQKTDAPNPYARQRQRALALAAAVHRQSTREHVFSHVTAALLHGLPVVGSLSLVHLVQSSAPGVRD